MDELQQDPSRSKKTAYFEGAVYFSLIAPLPAAILTYTILAITDKLGFPEWFESTIGFCGLLVLLSSFVSGFVTMFAVIGTSWKLGLAAFFGTLLSIVSTLLLFLLGFSLPNSNGHNC